MINNIKTLIGKNNYLFLINDSSKEIKIHNDNFNNVPQDFYTKYEPYKRKYLLIVIPNKSFVLKDYLPDGYNMIYRPGFNKYNEYLQNNIVDMYELFKYETNVFYKTDTHINLNGNYLIYKTFVDKINKLFHLNINTKTIKISEKTTILINENIGIGDLLWKQNLGDQIIDDITDTYYYSEDFELLYCKHKITTNDQIRLITIVNKILLDVTNNYIGHVIDWNIISTTILYKKNVNVGNKYKVLIFYDSMTLPMLSIYLNMFYNVYMCKDRFTNTIVDSIRPDYIFEFRIERFL